MSSTLLKAKVPPQTLIREGPPAYRFPFCGPIGCTVWLLFLWMRREQGWYLKHNAGQKNLRLLSRYFLCVTLQSRYPYSNLG
jgi:hypothetical protein